MSTSTNLFIDVEVAPEAASDPAVAAKLAEVCPVDIFAVGEGGELKIVEGKEDTASEKIARLAEAGIVVAEEIAAIPGIVKEKIGVRA